ncbi:MAG TPA: malonyl-CoA decarboxylase [Stellaceae bacterium]|nr:malonyl-CoA decarboxylase [Stellaceae bacterium]
MSDRNGGSFLDSVVDRTLGNLRSLRTAWRDIATTARGVLSGVPRPDLSRDDAERLRGQLRACLDARGGAVSARARAADLGRTYLALNGTGRERFLRLLAEEFDVDHATVMALSGRLRQADDEHARRAVERELHAALEPPRVKLLTQFNALPEGVKFLVDMRAELMTLAAGDGALVGLELDLKRLLAGWFDVDFLELKRITWDAPAALLEKLIVYEAVHEIRSWADLKNRLEADRRCFAYFHPRMPAEPLIFVEVALVQGISDNVQSLLDETAPVGDPIAADTAIFYSISNCQRGLAGISLGDFLIKRVVDNLAAELPHIKAFATLSPIPTFRAWLDKRLAEGSDDLLAANERRALQQQLPGERGTLGLGQLLAQPDWHNDAALAAALRGPMLRLAAQYLLQEKTARGRARDPVAHFHLTNGARMERLNWLADQSPKGLQQSAGIMINYLYRLSDIEANHEAYTGEGRVTAAGAVAKLTKG